MLFDLLFNPLQDSLFKDMENVFLPTTLQIRAITSVVKFSKNQESRLTSYEIAVRLTCTRKKGQLMTFVGLSLKCERKENLRQT
jgi:hypothetical protein